MRKITLLAFLAAAASVAAGAARADTAANWGQYCASCHGKDGAGKTRAGRLLGAKDLTDAAYQKTFTDEQAFKDVKDGLTADGKTKMRPIGDKLSDDEIKALVTFVRGLQK
jgi:cytochrome c553